MILPNLNFDMEEKTPIGLNDIQSAQIVEYLYRKKRKISEKEAKIILLIGNELPGNSIIRKLVITHYQRQIRLEEISDNQLTMF